jgi:hypothetical protein
MAKHSYYFKHDFNAHSDEKIVDLLMTHGLEGYGIFWYTIELLSSAENYKLESNYKRLAFSMRADEEKLRSVIEDFALFCFDSGSFWSNSLTERMNKLDEIKQKRAESGRKGGIAGSSKHEASISNIEANAKQIEANAKQIEAEKRKEKKRKEEIETPLLARDRDPDDWEAFKAPIEIKECF